MTDEYPNRVLPHDELAQVMPVEDPGTDIISRTRRAVALGLAVQWTANDTEVDLYRLVDITEHLTRYIATGAKPEEI